MKIFSPVRSCAALAGLLLWGSAAALAAVPPIFVLNSLEANVSVIDPVTWEETARIPTGKEPHHLYLTPDERSLIVANALGDTLTFLDPRTAQVQRTVRSGLQQLLIGRLTSRLHLDESLLDQPSTNAARPEPLRIENVL